MFISLFSLNVSANDDCIGCHAEQVFAWQKSDHAKAMSVATNDSVLGDFSDTVFEHYSQKARFYKNDEGFWVDFTEGGKQSTYSISHTFGHYPLQQYLIPTESGRYQIFPIAWDSRPKDQGGQRWYTVLASIESSSDEVISPSDRFHWQQPLANWNGMCADCHSDGLVRNFSVTDNQFQTRWQNINVGCQSCHGTIDKNHYVSVSQIHKDSESGEITYINHWQFEQAEGTKKVAKIATLKKAANNQFMESCFACHSLRSPLTDGIEPDTPFLDQFTPTLLSPFHYHADGQIKDEVYVYGSFLQSKMFDAGVNCLDCHDSHTMKVKTNTNGLCLQCHNSEVYQQESHLVHAADSEAAQCVSCHMPQTTYMGVDPRRDHSFSIPRPELTELFDVPNSCNGCHSSQDTQWAKEQIARLYPGNSTLSQSERNWITMQHQQYLPIRQHLAMINDPQLSEIKRASAIAFLPNSVQAIDNEQCKTWIASRRPLIRLAIAQVGFLMSPEERLKSFKNLLSDEFRAIRVAAAYQLTDLKDQLKGEDAQHFNTASAELMESHLINTWRGEGGLNKGTVFEKQNNINAAIESYEQAIFVDPYFEPSYANLADLYRRIGDLPKEKAIYAKSLQAQPGSALLNYNFALHLIRQNQYKEARQALEKTQKLNPENVQYAYALYIVLDNTGNTAESLKKLLTELSSYEFAPQLINLGLQLARKTRNKAAYDKLFKLQHSQ